MQHRVLYLHDPVHGLRSRQLTREEVISLVCALVFTGLFAIAMLYLRQAEMAERSFAVLMEYQEIIPAQRLSDDSSPLRSRSPGLQKKYTSPWPSTAGAITVDTLETPLATKNEQVGNILAVDSISAVIQTPPAPAVTAPRPMVRAQTHSMILDSISTFDPTIRQALLHQYFNHSSAVYDTATILHLTRLSNVFLKFDERPVSLEETMQLNMRRYGYPYDPNRPQAPSAQVPLGGIVSRLLGFMF